MIHLTFNGLTQSLTEWASSTGLNRTTIAKRLKAGFSAAAALDPKEVRGAHMKGRRRPEWVKKKIGDGVKRACGPSFGRTIFVPLELLHELLPTYLGIADSIVYADPLELLCAAETVDQRMAMGHG